MRREHNRAANFTLHHRVWLYAWLAMCISYSVLTRNGRRPLAVSIWLYAEHQCAIRPVS